MTTRTPLVVGDDGLIEQLQPGDNIPGSGGTLPEYGSDPSPLNSGDVWVLRTVENAAGTLQAFVGGFPIETAQDEDTFKLSYFTSLGTIVRTPLQ